MTWRRIAIYYVLGIVLGGYFLLFEWQPGGEKPIPGGRPRQQSRFLSIPQETIQEVRLHRGEDGAVTFRRDGQGWKVIEPPGAQVTSALMTSFVENLTMEKEVQVIEEAAGNLSPYGLERPHATVVIKGQEGNVVATVFIGDRNPTSSAVYACKESSPQVVLLGYSVRYYEELIFETAGIGKR
jgi:Domain of unknown function (DUF4340)